MNDNKKQHDTKAKTHDYHDTMNAAANMDDDSGETARRKENRLDSELAYETLAVSSCMGMLGMEEVNANLIQLELAQEVMYDLNNNRDDMRDPLD